MNALQVHITAGPQAGARLQLSQSPVSFGRSPDNTLVIDLPVVSRQHGELVFEDGQWVLVNRSANGTRLNRKRITKKPRPIADGASVVIGDEEVFRIYLTEAAAQAVPEATQEDQPQQPSQAPGAGLKGRSRLWLFAAIWFGLMIGLFVVLFAFFGDDGKDNTGPSNRIVLYANAEEVRDILKREPEREGYVASHYESHLANARDAYDSNPRDLYEAYDSYRRAMRVMPEEQDNLIGEDLQRYNDVEEELAELIYEQYDRAYRAERAKQFQRAVDILDDLRDDFPAPPRESEIARAILDLREKAQRSIPQ